VDYIHIRSDRVTPIYLAPAEQYQKVEDEKILRKIREKYSLNQPYILYVGDVNWNKNILGLLEAFRIVKTELKTSVNSSLNLVLAGSAFKKDNLAETRTIKAYIEKTGINQDIIRTGFVPDADLCGLYTGAMVLVQPSFAEGFGLVPLEAMASGCITLVSDNSSLSEIAGPSGLCDPNNPRDMADKLIRLINLSDKNRQNLIAQGISWAKTFSWQKTARATSLVYEKVLAG
jgi:glycosyltransferase involved in cell wall biosynthesis